MIVIRNTQPLRWAFFLLAVASGAAATAETCAPVLEPVAGEWPRFEVQLFEVTPADARPVDWRQIRLPGLQPLASLPFESEPAAYGAELYAAVLTPATPAAIKAALSALGVIKDIGPIHLSAAWGQPTHYRQRRALNYVQETAAPIIGAATTPAQVELNSVDTLLEVAVSGHPGTFPRTQLSIRWRQVTGWIKNETSPYEALLLRSKLTRVEHTPVITTAQLQTCLPLAGNALLVAGIPGITMGPDGRSESYREIAIVLRAY